MKKDYIKKIGVLVIAIITSFLLSACGGVDVEIHFDSNGGTEVESIETSGTTTISLPDNPEKEGYIFGGWFWDDETFEEPFTANSLLDTPLSSSMTVYARWVDPNVEEDSGLPVVTYHNTGDSDIEPIEVAVSSYLEVPQVSKDGHRLEGWYTSLDGGTSFDERWSFTTTRVNTDIDLYANWEILDYTVSFDSGLYPEDFESQDITYNETIDLPALSLEDYHFKGWLLDGEHYEGEITIKTDAHLVADFEEIIYHTVSFESASDASFDAITVEQGETIDLPKDTLDHHRFLGWTLDGEAFSEEDPVMDDITLVADFEAINYYQISFDSGEGSEIPPIKDIEEYTTVQALDTPELFGYAFKGWLYEESLIEAPFTYDFDQDITLEAKWESVPVYEITFDSLSGSAIESILVEENQPIESLPEPTLEHYRFLGWKYNDQYLETPFTYDFDEDIILIAEFEAIEYYDITLEIPKNSTISGINVSGGAIEPITVEEYQMIEDLPEPSIEHYSFMGWVYEGEILTQPFEYDFDQDITLTTTWQAINYDINFDTTSGSALDSLEGIEEYSTVEYLPTPTSDDYIFQGWLYDDELIEAPFEYDFDQDITLVATWRPAEIYQVEFTSIVGSIDALEFSEINDMVEDLPEPTYDNFVFEAWVLDGEEIELPFQMTEDITLEAVWTAKDNGLSLKTYQDGLIITGYDGDQEILDIPKMYQDIAIIAIAEEAFSGETSIKTLNLLSNILIIEENAFLSSTIEEINSEFLIQPQGWHDHFNPDNITVNFTSITISFETHGSEEIAAIEIYEPSDLNLSVPVKEGYIFSHWYLDADYEEVFDEANFPNEDITLHAKWVADYYDYEMQSNGVKITGYTGDETTLTMPEYIEMMPVRVIGEWAISSFDLLEFNLADNVEVIEQYGFRAYNLEAFNISEDSQLKRIDEYALENVGKLTSFYLPPNLEYIQTGRAIGAGFQGSNLEHFEVDENNPYFTSIDGVVYAHDLTKLIMYPNNKTDATFVIPKDVEVIISAVLFNNPHLESIHFEEGSKLHTIEWSNMYRLENLSSLEIPKNLETIGGVFLSEVDLSDLTVHPDNETFAMKDDVLYGDNMTSIYYVLSSKEGTFEVPDTVRIIEMTSFQGSHLESIIFGEHSQLRRVDHRAFEKMPNLTHISFPRTLSLLEINLFSESDNLEFIDVHEDNPNYTSIDGVLYSDDLKTLVKYPSAKATEEFIVPDHVEIIYHNAFTNTEIQTLTFGPDSQITEIRSRAFDEPNIAEIFIPKTVTVIDLYGIVSSDPMFIYIEAEEKPEGWHDSWYYDHPIYGPHITWGAERD